MLALTEAALGPLGGVVVGVDEAGDEELGGGEAVEGGAGGFYKAFDLIWIHMFVKGSNFALGVDSKKGRWEDLKVMAWL